MTNKEYLVDVFHSNERMIENFKILIESHKILIETNTAYTFSVKSIKNLRQTNQNLLKSIEILRQTNEKIKRAVEGQKVIIDIEPIEENFGATAIRCNYCILQAEGRCALIFLPLRIVQQCCSQHKLPVDYSRVESKLPVVRLTEFLKNSLQ